MVASWVQGELTKEHKEGMRDMVLSLKGLKPNRKERKCPTKTIIHSTDRKCHERKAKSVMKRGDPCHLGKVGNASQKKMHLNWTIKNQEIKNPKGKDGHKGMRGTENHEDEYHGGGDDDNDDDNYENSLVPF